jgi:hypothetical protein
LGLFPLCRIVSFVDSLDTIEAASRALLEGLFESLSVHTVRLSPRHRPVTLEPAEAIGVCSLGMADLKPLRNGSRGISFALEQDGKGKSDWELFLHRGPLPLLDLSTLVNGGFDPAPGWGAGLINEGTVDVFCDSTGYFGGQHHIYLLFKQRRLFPYSLAQSAPEAVAAGLELRRVCLKVSARGSHQKPEPYLLSGGNSGKRRFLRQFDRALLDSIESASLEQIFEAMGITKELWLQEK